MFTGSFTPQKVFGCCERLIEVDGRRDRGGLRPPQRTQGNCARHSVSMFVLEYSVLYIVARWQTILDS